MTEFKYVWFVDGPLVKYRFDIFLNGSPDIKGSLIILTTQFSYEVYKDYHEQFEFIVIDDLRKTLPGSIENELFPQFATDEDWIKGVHTVYNRENYTFFPYDLHRVALVYLAERGIFNFNIVDSDMLYQPDLKLHERVFSKIEPGTTYTPPFGVSPHLETRLDFFKNDVQKHFPDFNFYNTGQFIDADGFVRGFHFKSKEDQLLFFEIWNKSVELLMSDRNKYINILGFGNRIFQIEWVVSYIMQYFGTNLGYKHRDFFTLYYQEHKNVIVHKTRVEDTFSNGPRPQWDRYKFDYSDTTNITSFIKNNKSQLNQYWQEHVPTVEITDNHVYTRIY